MDVVLLSIISFMVILIPSGISNTVRCPSDGIVGCSCSVNIINCGNAYTGIDIPRLGESNTTYNMVS